MNITNAFLEGLAGSAANVKNDFTVQRSDEFEKTLSKVSKPDKDKENANVERKKADSRDNRGPQGTERQQSEKTRNTDGRERGVKADRREPAKAGEAKETVRSGEKLSGKEKDELNDNMVSVLAQSLNMTPETIKDLLGKLNLDAADLLDKGNLNKFMQAAFGVSSPVDLLQVPNIDEIFKNVTDGFSKALETALNVNAGTNMAMTEDVTQTAEVSEDAAGNMGMEATALNAQSPILAENQAQANMGQNQNNSGQYTEQDGTVLITNAHTEVRNTTNMAARLEAQRSADPQEVIGQIIDKIKVDVKANSSEMRLTLRPESLGEISLKVVTQNGIVTAQFVAESQRIKEILESNMDQLKDVLAQQGINISELSVNVSQEENKQMQEYLQQKSKSQMRINSILSSINSDDEEASEAVDLRRVHRNNVEYIV